MCLATPYSAFFSKNPAPLNTRLFANHLLKESEKVGLKLSIQKTNIMASGPLTSWEIDGETVETVSGFVFLDSKITADGYLQSHN